MAWDGQHQLQDLQSLTLHEEAVRRVKADPALLQQAKSTVERWLESATTRTAPLLRDWVEILNTGAWRKVLGRTAHAQQLRQASPLVTLLPESVRQSILAEVGELKRGVEVGKGVRARARQMHGSDGDSS